MKNMIGVLFFVIVAAIPVFAQETNAISNAVVQDVISNTTEDAVTDAIPENMDMLNDEMLNDDMSDDMLNDEIGNDEIGSDEMVNDEGYGVDDAEYYGAEEEINAVESNVESNTEQPTANTEVK
jgi:hypothetical protein